MTCLCRHTHSQTALEVEDGQHHAPAVLHPRKNPSRIVQEAEWASALVWMCMDYLVPPPDIRCRGRPARSESLYQLSHPGRLLMSVSRLNHERTCESLHFDRYTLLLHHKTRYKLIPAPQLLPRIRWTDRN